MNYARGGREATKRLGVRILAPTCGASFAACSLSEAVALYTSMIARHVDAIVSDGYNPALPTFRKVRKAGILLISSGDDIAGGATSGLARPTRSPTARRSPTRSPPR